jgi:iron complex outermembrane recepter protein
VLRPVEALDIAADYYYIKKRDVITQSNPAAALAAYYAGQPIPAGYTITPDVPDPAAPGALARPAVVESPYLNSNSLSTDGLDIDVRVNTSIVPGLRYTSELEATKIFSWKLVLPDGTAQQYVGTEGPYNLSSGAGTPRYRARWTNTASFGPATVSAIAYYTSGFYMFGPDVAPATFCLYQSAAQPNCRVPSFIDVDLTGSWRFTDHLTVSAAMENVLDRRPPLDPANYAAVNYNPTYSQAGIIGRFFRVGLSYKF